MLPPELLAIAGSIVGGLVAVIRQQSMRIDRLENRIDALAETIAHEQNQRHILNLTIERLRAGYNRARVMIIATAVLLRADKMPDLAHIDQMDAVPTVEEILHIEP